MARELRIEAALDSFTQFDTILGPDPKIGKSEYAAAFEFLRVAGNFSFANDRPFAEFPTSATAAEQLIFGLATVASQLKVHMATGGVELPPVGVFGKRGAGCITPFFWPHQEGRRQIG